MVAGPLALPTVIPLAFGAALGGADALRVLLALAGRHGPFIDIAICVSAMCVATAHLLAAALVARFVRAGEAAGHGQGAAARARRAAAAATDRLARVTLTVSVGVACLAAACLLAASGSGVLDGFPAWRSGPVIIIDTPVGVAAVVVAVAGAALLVGFVSRGVRNGPGNGGGAAMDARRFGKPMTPLAVIVSTTACLLAIPYVYTTSRGEDACSSSGSA